MQTFTRRLKDRRFKPFIKNNRRQTTNDDDFGRVVRVYTVRMVSLFEICNNSSAMSQTCHPKYQFPLNTSYCYFDFGSYARELKCLVETWLRVYIYVFFSFH